VGRRPFEHRRIVVCQDAADALDALEKNATDRILSARARGGGRPFVFMFSGQGAQYPNMGRGLYESEPVFRKEIDRCAEILLPVLGLDIRNILYPVPDEIEQAAEKLQHTHLTQPALFVTEYALAKMLLGWMPAPEAMIGHSLGEYVAACLAGVFSLEDALLLVAERGRLMEAQPAGAMTSVSLPVEEVRPLLIEGVEIATLNAPGSCVVSGPFNRIEEFESRLGEKKTLFRRLRTSHAFHSAMMVEPAIEPLKKKVRTIQRNPPRFLPFHVTGTWITDEEATIRPIGDVHITPGVRFSDELRKNIRNPNWGYLEIGPGNTLASFVRQHGQEASGRTILFKIRHPQDEQPDTKVLMTTVGNCGWAESRLTGRLP
jgi:acyl transferase domain-containing protein